ncbi:MAG: hypothetical protein KUG74_03160 [Rhodobacteraceae bacterium]|nr:hypothetical protein [Paracoccaceae bacterium]
MSETANQSVKRRHMFYIPGYDPMVPRRYRELYRSEGGDQARISGYGLKLGPKQIKTVNYGWVVDTEINGLKTHTDVEFLQWSDIVQTSMNKNIFGTYVLLARTAWEYIGSGALWHLMRLRIGPILAALYPVMMLVLQLFAAMVAAGLVFWLSSVFLHWAIGAVAGVALACSLLIWFKSKDAKLFAYYLMHDYGFSAQFKGKNPPELEARMAEFADRIAEVLRLDVDEVLIVGHSSGAHLAVSVLSDLIRRGAVQAGGAPLGLLTLGQVIPMVSFLRDASRLRRDLHFLSTQDCLSWVDVSAPGDGANFALCDAVSVSGVAPEQGKLHPLVLSAAFSQTLSKQAYDKIKKRFFRLHFQYLCAFDQPGEYDYFQVTGGPMTLKQRFANRAPSPSRIEVPVNKYTSRDPEP